MEGVSSMNLYLWHWLDAPTEYKALSQHAGDEDWVLFAPNGAEQAPWPLAISDVISGAENSYLDGFGHVDRHELPGGVLVIFAHA